MIEFSSVKKIQKSKYLLLFPAWNFWLKSQITNENQVSSDRLSQNTVNGRVKTIFHKLNAITLTERQTVFAYEDECVENRMTRKMTCQCIS